MGDPANERPAVADVLDAVGELVDRYIVFPSPASTRAVALFVATTWVAVGFDIAPYLLVTGPEKRTGKSTLLDVIALLVRAPILAASMAEAVLFRVIDAQSPTVLRPSRSREYGRSSTPTCTCPARSSRCSHLLTVRRVVAVNQMEGARA